MNDQTKFNVNDPNLLDVLGTFSKTEIDVLNLAIAYHCPLNVAIHLIQKQRHNKKFTNEIKDLIYDNK
jgi:hypothetical protein